MAEYREERRKSPRFVMNQLFELSVDRETFVPVQGIDISEEGLRCIMGDELGPYTRVYVMFTLNYNGQERIIRTQGIVTNCQLDIRSGKEQTYAAGIKLIDMMDEDKDYIEEYLREKIRSDSRDDRIEQNR